MKPSNKWAPNTQLSFVMFFVILVVAATSKALHQIDPNPLAASLVALIGASGLFFCIWQLVKNGGKPKTEAAYRWYYFGAVLFGLVIILTSITLGL